MLLATLLLTPFAVVAVPPSAVLGFEPPGHVQEALSENGPVWARELSDSLENAKGVYLAGLGELAGWCQTNGAFACRNLALEDVLHFRPDDAKARKFLRYRFDRKTDSWVRRGNFRSPSDRGAAATAEYAARRDALDAVYVGQSMDAIEAAEEKLGPAKTFTALRDLYALAPGQPRLLERLGYTNVAQPDEPPRWVSAFSLTTPARRLELKAWLAEARQAETEIKDATPDEIDLAIKVEWREARTVALGPTSRLRMLTRVTPEETETALGVAATSIGFLTRLVDEKPLLGAPWTLYLPGSQENKARFIASYPGLDEDERRSARELGSMWMPGKKRCAVWGADPVWRADMVCKQVAVRFLANRFEIKTKRGWLVEALGLYINDSVVGTRLSRHVAVTDYTKPGEVPVSLGLEKTDADWLKIASRILVDLETRDFARALGRNTSEMTPQDVVVTYGLVAFLCEGAEPGALKYILEQVGSDSASSVKALEAHFSLPLFEIQLRLQAWLEDVVAAASNGADEITDR